MFRNNNIKLYNNITRCYKLYNNKLIINNNNKNICLFKSYSSSSNGENLLKDQVSGVDIKSKFTSQQPPKAGSTGDKYLDMYSGEIPKDENNMGPSTSSMSRSDFAKSLLLMRKSGTLSSVNMLAKMESESSSPVYGSIVPYGILEEDGGKKLTPIIMLKRDDNHIKHFKHFNKVSLVVYPLTPVNRPPAAYALSRINFGGRMTPITNEGDQLATAKKVFLKKHPGATRMVESSENVFYKLDLSDIYHYERKGTSRVSLQDFANAKADEICVESREIIESLNDKHIETIRVICEQYGDIQIDEAFVYFVDSHGLNCIAKKKGIEEWLDVRIPFDKPFATIKDCKVGLLETINEIKQKHLS